MDNYIFQSCKGPVKYSNLLSWQEHLGSISHQAWSGLCCSSTLEVVFLLSIHSL